LRLHYVIWKEQFVEKIAETHAVDAQEVEEVLFSGPHVRKVQKGRIKGEHLYVAYCQTAARRYLVVFFIYKREAAALPISARDMTKSERSYFSERKKD